MRVASSRECLLVAAWLHGRFDHSTKRKLIRVCSEFGKIRVMFEALKRGHFAEPCASKALVGGQF